MPALLQFLTVILPLVPELASQFRSAFVQVGGDPADFDKILAEIQTDIDVLKNPDSLRRRKTAMKQAVAKQATGKKKKAEQA